MPVYPLPITATHSILTPPRNYNSPRTDPARPGRRHGACDLYAPHGTPVLACEAGTVTVEGLPGSANAVPYAFVRYAPTAPWVYALEVKCDTGKVIRYGECVFLPHLKYGYKVSEGEQIGWVVKMAGLQAPGNCMLHFELYTGTGKGPLNQPIPPYYRRADLIDPSTYLTSAQLPAPSTAYVKLPPQISLTYSA